MKNKKGFTLIELIGVIVIMGILIALAVPAVLNISSKIRFNMYCKKIAVLESNSTLWGQDNISLLPVISGTQTHENVTFTRKLQVILDAGGYIKADDKSGNILDPRDNKTKLNTLNVKIFVKNKRVYAKIPISENCE